MHINKKIFTEVSQALESKYFATITDKEKDAFSESHGTDERYLRKQQKIAIAIIDRILKKHEKDDLTEVIRELAEIELNVLYMLGHVRDHVIHAVNTFLLGVYILEKVVFPKDEESKEDYDYPFIWKLCGPTHDLGYSIEIGAFIVNPFVSTVNDILRDKSPHSPPISPHIYPYHLNSLCKQKDSNKLIQAYIRDCGIKLDIDDYFNYLRSEQKIDHGVIGALTQLKLIDSIYQRHNPRRERKLILYNGRDFNQEHFEKYIVSTSAALFLHNIDSGYEEFKDKIDFNRAPLSFLLYLCDNFQEWDRFAKYRKVYSGELFDIVCDNSSISLTVPPELAENLSRKLSQRLTGLEITVNGNLIVSIKDCHCEPSKSGDIDLFNL